MPGVREGAPLPAAGWSSSLSVAEHTAVREAGFTPRGLVMGSSVYHLGPSYGPGAWGAGTGWGGGAGPAGGWGGGAGWGGGYRGSFPGWCKYYSWSDLGMGGGMAGGMGRAPWPGAPVGRPGMGGPGGMGMGMGGWGVAATAYERYAYEQGVEEAARLALERMEAEVRELRAHGAIGIRLNFRYLEGLPATIEFTALGTAVTRAGAGATAVELPRPFTSHLDGQALLKLIRAGLVPVAAAVGVGSVMAELPRFAGTSMELRPFGDAIEMSRRIAAQRLQRAARSGGWAVVGTLAAVSTRGEGEGELSTTVLTGTVVRRFATGRWERLPTPVMRLSRP